MKLETDKQLVRDNLSSRCPNFFRYFMDGLVVPSSDYIPIYVYNCVIFRARVSTWNKQLLETQYFLHFYSFAVWFYHSVVHFLYIKICICILYIILKLSKRAFRWTSTQVAIFQTLFSPLWKTVETSIGPFLWEWVHCILDNHKIMFMVFQKSNLKFLPKKIQNFQNENGCQEQDLACISTINNKT